MIREQRKYSQFAGMTYQRGLIILKVLKPLIDSFSYRRVLNFAAPSQSRRHVPSGVWNIPVPTKSSLVGLPPPEFPPGRGEAGARRAEGPIEAREFIFLPSLGPGEGDGLVEGGRRVDIGC